ncbi:hypothetical protein GALMADRAFT_222998 [Galerina marginata CBS 339.88]|uniref:LIM zinc-binding domain-containing protein n=1 Tax=Galerina marginata (strain CBS 339.88) TaxID=685588 RepID=A0A067TAD4_GALM3|nr:hypothetical protein GALMADRAFT_222998 [Galerina marginata CBS 339.88]
MAHNQGFYQGQGQPVQQQQQYSPVFQQPQNIYQQLGKPQPQPHLQRHPTYTAQQAQQQPIQPQGFQFGQPQYLQGPPQPMQAPYALTQTPYASPQTPYPLSQTPYIPSHTPFTSQTPYPASQPQYAPAQIPYPPPPTPQQYPIQQQQVQPVYTSHAPTISRAPTSSFPNPTPSAVPASSSGSSWRASIPRPPPVSPSASLAQQAQAQAPPIQVRSTPQTPQTPARRPLPQPSPGANAQPPALPPANAPQRIPTLSSIGSTSSGTARPFPIQPIQTTLPQSSKTPSPTRSRPLPTPTEPNKRATVDLGKLPHSASGSGPSFSSASNSTFSTTSVSASNWPPQKREQSPTRPLPSVADRKQLESSGLSRTSSYAVNLNSGVDSSPVPKRRASPPRFQSQPSSTSNSPVKESSPITSWNSNNPASGPINSTAPSSAKFINSNSSNSSVNNLTTDNPSSSTTAPPKKFVPMWKRTIPEMPAPAWGYAAGMVSEPHPKPKSQPAPATTQSAAPTPSTKGNGKLKKLSGAPSQSLAAASIPASPTKTGSQYQQQQQQHSNILNSEYPRSSAIQQRHPPNQQQSAQYTQGKSPNNHAVRGYTSKPQHEEDEEEEEEETEEDGEEDEEETEESEEDQSDHRYVVHTRHHGQSQNGRPAQQQSRGRYEHEDTPKKKVLRPKVAVDPYAGYTEASPSSKARRDRQETYPVVKESPTKITLRPKVRTSMTEDDERTPKKIIRHARSKSAFEEREVVSHRRDPGERDRPRPGSAFAGPVPRRRRDYEIEEDAVRLAYEDSEEEDDEEESEIEWKKTPKKKAIGREVDRRQGSEPQYGIRDLPANRRSGSGSGGGARYSDDYEEEEEEEDNRYRRPAGRGRGYRDAQEKDWGRDPEPERGYRGTGAGLPQPPAMAREPGGGPERKVRGGPRLKSAPLKFDDYEEEQDHRQQDLNQGRESLHMRFSAMNVDGNGSRSDSRGSSSSGVWPADLPRLPRTPGSATTPGSVTNDGSGYFEAKPQPIAMSGSGFGGRQSQGQENMNRNKGIQNRRTNLDLDDPPPRATVIRTPSPGPSGYTLKRELPQPQGRPQSQVQPPSAHRSSDLNRRQSLYSAPSAPIHGDGDSASQRRPQSQIYGQMQPSFSDRQPAQQQQRGSHLAQYSNHLSQASNNARHQPQTPAPPPTVGIESPHPVGGRDKLADIPKLEEDSNHGSDTEGRGIPRIRVDPSPTSNAPRIQVDSAQPSIPMINVNSSPHMGNVPMINVEMDSTRNDGPKIQIYEVPGISVSGPGFDDHQAGPSINISGPDDHNGHRHGQRQPQRPPSQSHSQPRQKFDGQPRTGGLICGGCNGPIIGRIVSAMGSRWHPACFKCTVCSELLEHVSSYEHEGRPYCHLDYHENFAPRCYTCETAIIEEQFISLDDPGLGKRAYHTQHFFCAECGDPFLSPSGSLPTDSKGELALSGDGEFEGFTVYKGHPYCEACHVRLRLPKCKRCKRSIRDNDEAVEALGGKWCWGCFVCASCEKPFEDPSFFQRGDQPFCEHCFSIMLRNEI